MQAWRTHRLIAGEPREIVVVHSPKLHAGQVRGLGQTMARATTAIQELDSDSSRLSLEAVRQRMKPVLLTELGAIRYCRMIDRTGNR